MAYQELLTREMERWKRVEDGDNKKFTSIDEAIQRIKDKYVAKVVRQSKRKFKSGICFLSRL